MFVCVYKKDQHRRWDLVNVQMIFIVGPAMVRSLYSNIINPLRWRSVSWSASFVDIQYSIIGDCDVTAWASGPGWLGSPTGQAVQRAQEVGIFPPIIANWIVFFYRAGQLYIAYTVLHVSWVWLQLTPGEVITPGVHILCPPFTVNVYILCSIKTCKHMILFVWY